MKMLTIIISSLFICSLSETFNLTAGEPKKITDLEKENNYFFLIKSSEYSKLTFTFTMSNIYKDPFNYILFQEIKSYYSSIMNLKNLTFSTNETNSEIIISASHIVYEYDIIFLEINLTSNIKEIIIKVDEEIGSYDLHNSSRKIDYLLPDFSYYFYRNASEDLRINFNLTFDYLDSDPIKDIFIYESIDWAKTKRSRLLQNITQSFIPIKQGNQLLISFQYIVSQKNIDNVGILVKPAHKIYNVEVKMDLLAEFYNLENRKSITVKNLIPEKYYFFFINIEMYNEIEFSINMDKINDVPFNNTGILRYKKADSSFTQYTKIIAYNNHTTIKANKLEISFHYSSSDDGAPKIALLLQPLSNIDYINIKVENEGVLHELIDGIINVSNLKANTSYYFYTGALFAHTLNINFTMKSSLSTPFSSINIYEQNSKQISKTSTANIPISIEKKDDILFTSFSYTITKNNCKYIFIEIKSPSIIDSITAKIEQNVEFYYIDTPKTLYNLTSEKFHYFNMKIGGYSKVYINITLDKVDNNPFIFSELYLTDNALSFTDFSENKYDNFSQIIDNKTVITIVYKSNLPDEKYSSFRIKPFNDLDLININTFEIISSFEIINGVSQNITNLEANNTIYLFYKDHDEYLNYDIYFSMKYMEDPPFDYLYTRDGQGMRLAELKKYMYKTDSEWVIKYHYNSLNQLAKTSMDYIITPKKNIEYLFTRIVIYYSRMQFDSDSDEKKLTVYSGVQYHMAIKSQYNKTILLNFKMDTIYSNSFSFLDIYEYNDLINPYYNKIKTINLKDKIKGDKIEIPISYKVENTSTNYTFIDFIPIKDVRNLIINLNVTNTTNQPNESDNDEKENNNNFNSYYIIVPIIIIVVIILIIFIIIFVKRKNKISSEIIENKGQQPLFTNQETEL